MMTTHRPQWAICLLMGCAMLTVVHGADAFGDCVDDKDCGSGFVCVAPAADDSSITGYPNVTASSGGHSTNTTNVSRVSASTTTISGNTTNTTSTNATVGKNTTTTYSACSEQFICKPKMKEGEMCGAANHWSECAERPCGAGLVCSTSDEDVAGTCKYVPPEEEPVEAPHDDVKTPEEAPEEVPEEVPEEPLVVPEEPTTKLPTPIPTAATFELAFRLYFADGVFSELTDEFKKRVRAILEELFALKGDLLFTEGSVVVQGVAVLPAKDKNEPIADIQSDIQAEVQTRVAADEDLLKVLGSKLTVEAALTDGDDGKPVCELGTGEEAVVPFPAGECTVTSCKDDYELSDAGECVEIVEIPPESSGRAHALPPLALLLLLAMVTAEVMAW